MSTPEIMALWFFCLGGLVFAALWLPLGWAMGVRQAWWIQATARRRGDG